MTHDYCTCGADRVSCIDCAEAEIDRLTAQLAERDNKIKVLNEYCIQLDNSIVAASYVFGIDREPLAVVRLSSKKYAALRTKLAECEKEVERLKEVQGICEVCEVEAIKHAGKARKQAAREILDALTQEEIRRITSVGDPRVTTISSKMLAMMAELRQRYGLEG